MEFLDPKKRKAHRQKLFIGYGLIAIALTMMTMIIVFAAYGFDIDRKTGEVIQNGMIIVSAAPESARISINGTDEGTTDKRLSLPAGRYSVELAREGYRTWRHDVDLVGSAIEQLVYPFLFPADLSTKTLQAYTARPALTSQSPDRRWLLTQRPGDAAGTFQVVDLNDKDNPVSTVVLPSGIASTGQARQFSVVEWSTNNTDVLLKHTYDGKTEFIVLNRSNPSRSRNVTTTLGERTFTDVTLRDKQPDQFYLYNQADRSLYSSDLRNRQYALVASKVLSYKAYQKDTIMYVSPSSADTNKVTVHVIHKGRDRAVRSIAASPTYLLDAADFDGSLYMAIGGSNEPGVYLYKDPLSRFNNTEEALRSFRALTLPGATRISFSANARFISVQSGSQFAVYDAETERQFRYDTELAIVDKTHAAWMDGHRLSLVDRTGTVRVFDFDGTNMHELNTGVPGSDVYFDRDYTALFVLAPNEQTARNATVLTRTELRLDP